MRLPIRFAALGLATIVSLPALTGCAVRRHEPATDVRQQAVTERPAHRRAIIVSCDGAGDEWVDRLIAEGHLPHLAALRAKGLVADHARTSFPSKTAAGHASLWTGAYADRNGISSNRPPRWPAADHDLNEASDGFDASILRAEPLWITAARQGKRTILVQATHTTPMDAYRPGGKYGDYADRLRVVDFYAGQLGRHTHQTYGPGLPVRPADWPDAPKGSLMVELPGAGDTGTMPALLVDDPADPTIGFDTLAVSPERRWQSAIKLKPGEAGRFSTAVPWPDSGQRQAFFRLWELGADGRHFRLTRTPISRQIGNRDDLPSLALGAVAGGPERLYAEGGLGPTVLQGGDGTAEQRYVESIAHTLDNRLATAKALMSQGEDWDLTCIYVPFPDAAKHMWLGLLDPASPHYRPAAAAVIRDALIQVYGKVDQFIGQVATIEPTAALSAVSDHGLEGVHWEFYPNVLLARAGLLATLPDGTIDLSRTRVLYPVHDGAALVVNRIGRKGGLVMDDEVPQLLERAKAALLAARDPRTGQPVVTRFWEPDAELGNTGYGDLYLDLAPGYYFHHRTTAANWWAPLHPFSSGGHIFHPARRSMQAMFALAGPDIPALSLGPVRTIDVAPTICHYLGLQPPLHAVGRNLLASDEPR